MFMVRLFITRVFVKHIWGSRFTLGFNNRFPNLGCGYNFPRESISFVFLVKFFKLFTIHVRKTLRLIGTKQRPIPTGFNTFHEQIRNPHCRKQVATPRLFVTLVQTNLKEIEYIGVPWFQVYGDGPFSAPSLVYVPRGRVIYPKHGDNPIGGPVRTSNV